MVVFCSVFSFYSTRPSHSSSRSPRARRGLAAATSSLRTSSKENSSSTPSAAEPLPAAVDAAIQSAPIDVRRSLYGNIVLTGAGLRPGA